MQVYLDELGLLNRVIFCKNGEEVVEYFKKALSGLKADAKHTNKKICARPVTLLLMDINMPFKSGLEATKEVCELFQNFNKQW